MPCNSGRFLKFSVFLLLLSACLLIACTRSKISVLTTFSAQEYAEDLEELATLLSANHPAYERFKSGSEISSIKERLQEEISEKTTVGEFAWKCRTLMAAIGCGHTYMPSQGTRLYLPEKLRFPIKVVLNNNALVVVDPLENKGKVARGDTVTSVNGIPVEEVISRLKNRVSADGYNASFIASLINDGINDYLAYEMGFPSSFQVESRSGLQKLTATVDPLISPSVLPSCPQRLCFQLRVEDNLGIMTIRSFEFYNSRLPQFTDFVDKAVAQLRESEVDNLIIDIRGNGGGDPYCSSYLIRNITERSIQYYHESVRGYDDLKEPLEGLSNGYDGKVFVLSNGKNFSTSGHFLSLVREHRLALIAGTESGATYSCNARQMNFTLQHTGLSGSIARSIYKTQVSEMPLSRGILPDLVISLTQDGILNNKDEQLDKLITHIIEHDE